MEKTEEELKEMKQKAFELQQVAVTAAYEYFCACPLGDERVRAHDFYQNLRLAHRV